VEGGLTGMSWNGTLGALCLTSRRFVKGLSGYVQEQRISSNVKREKANSTEYFFSQWTQIHVLWRDYRPVLLARQG
jgi:hypothetical protein